MTRRTTRRAFLVSAVGTGAGVLVAGCAQPTAPAATSAPAKPVEATKPVATAAPAAATAPLRVAASGALIERVPRSALPGEALDTIALIQAGGPFPYERDGVTFGNYEEHLPDAPFGSYREYTVVTPGLEHRGARRIVAGDDGAALYYTADHYESFVEVILPDDQP